MNNPAWKIHCISSKNCRWHPVPDPRVRGHPQGQILGHMIPT